MSFCDKIKTTLHLFLLFSAKWQQNIQVMWLVQYKMCTFGWQLEIGLIAQNALFFCPESCCQENLPTAEKCLGVQITLLLRIRLK